MSSPNVATIVQNPLLPLSDIIIDGKRKVDFSFPIHEFDNAPMVVKLGSDYLILTNKDIALHRLQYEQLRTDQIAMPITHQVPVKFVVDA